MKRFILLSILFLLACKDDTDDLRQVSCDGIACTEIFISFSVTVKDPSGVAIPLDSFRVSDLDTGEDLTPELTPEERQIGRQNGSYPLYSDLTDTDTPGISRTLLFEGFIGGTEVVSASYRAGRDCCHAAIADGNLNLILQD